MSIRNGSGAQLSQIQIRPSQQISNAIQQLRGAARVDGSVQILLGIIGGYKNQFPKVARRGNGELQRREDM